MDIKGIQNVIQQMAASIPNRDTANPSRVHTSAPEYMPENVPAADTKGVHVSGQDKVNELLQELIDKLSVSQKTMSNMPDSLKNEIRALLAQKATLFDLGGGLVHLVQGQKDIFGNLNRLADTLSELAKFIAQANQPDKLPLPDSMPSDFTDKLLSGKDSVLGKMDAQLLKQLLNSIAEKAGLPTDKQTPPEKAQPLPQTPGKNDGQPSANMVNRYTSQSITKPKQSLADNIAKLIKDAPALQGQTPAPRIGQTADNLTKAIKDLLTEQGQTPAPRMGQTADNLAKAIKDLLTEQGQTPAPRMGQTADNLAKAIKDLLTEQGQTPAPRMGQTADNLTKAIKDLLTEQGQMPAQRMGQTAVQGEKTISGAKTGSSFSSQDMAAVKGRLDIPDGKILEEMGRTSQTVRRAPEGQPVSEGTKAADGRPQAARAAVRGNVLPENSLLNTARQSLPENKGVLPRPLNSGDLHTLFKNMTTVSQKLVMLAERDTVFGRALQTLTDNPAFLSIAEKNLLHSMLSKVIKETFAERDELTVLGKALGRLQVRDGLFLDQETLDLQSFTKLLKNAQSLQYSRQQVENWAHSLRELADGMIKTTALPSERSAQHLQTAFVFHLATDGLEKNTPVYINIYHEKEKENRASEKNAETWIRVNVSPEYVGKVTAIFHLYQENLLDVKVLFDNPEGMEEFRRFLPNIEETLHNTGMRLNNILLI